MRVQKSKMEDRAADAACSVRAFAIANVQKRRSKRAACSAASITMLPFRDATAVIFLPDAASLSFAC